MLALALCAAAVFAEAPPPAKLSWSAGFASDMVLQVRLLPASSQRRR